MDHHLDDPLHLEGSIGVDFDHSDVIVSEADIDLDSGDNVEEIPMEFEHIEEQPMLMESVADLMGEQFILSEDNSFQYQDDQHEVVTTAAEEIDSQIIMNNDDMVVQFESPAMNHTVQVELNKTPSIIKLQPHKFTRVTPTAMPRHISIAPKPPPATENNIAYTVGKQYPIAPKPVTIMANDTANAVRKVRLASVVQSKPKPVSTLLGQMEKVVMVSGVGAPKVRYMTADSEQVQLIKKKNIVTIPTSKPLLAKFIVQGQKNSNQSAVLTKIVPGTISPVITSQATKYATMQTKPVQYPVKNKILLGSPIKSVGAINIQSTNKLLKIKSSPQKLVPQSFTAKKIMIPEYLPQNVMLKAVTSQPLQSVNSDSEAVSTVSSSNTQLHKINMPGKGVQYIRLVTNTTTGITKPVPVKPISVKPASTTNATSLCNQKKTLLYTDSKSRYIVQPGTNVCKVQNKAPQRFVQIAPVSQTNQLVRSSQSLLAPVMSTEAEPASPQLKKEALVEDSKDALRQLIEETVLEESTIDIENNTVQEESPHEVEIEFEDPPNAVVEDDTSNMIEEESNDDQLIVYPENFDSEQSRYNMENIINMDHESVGSYQQPETSPEIINNDLALRLRKACNCTKSQCLKLYCDCFANGEFCNQCNCTNCHNNMDNEELRQKAIRGCLERNPNAFRPKIGKAKNIGGPTNIRRHNKGCNCKRSGCLKNYCECYEAKIACSGICKCVGCRNVEESVERMCRLYATPKAVATAPAQLNIKQPCRLMKSEVIEAVCQCMLAAAGAHPNVGEAPPLDPVCAVIEEFGRCLQEIIGTAQQAAHSDDM